MNPMSRTRVGRIARSMFRRPNKTQAFLAKNERLATAADLVRYGY